MGRFLAALPILFTLLPLSRTGRGYVRIWDFPRLQIVAAAVLAEAWLAVRGSKPRDRVLQAALAASIAFQVSKIWPYTPFHCKQALGADNGDPSRRVRILICNVLMENRQKRAVRDLVREADPDVFCLLETDLKWEKRLQVLEREYRYTIKCPLENKYGMHLYSRLPLSNPETRFLVEQDIPSMKAELRLPSGDTVMLHCLHPRPPRPADPSYGRDAELVMVGREIAEDGRPTIVAGDLNDVAWSYTTNLFQKTSRMLDPRVGRGMFNTFWASFPLLRYPLDHVFHTDHFTLAGIQRLRKVGSDHFPICADLVYDPSKSEHQEAPIETAEDRENAEEMIDDLREHADQIG